MEEDGNNGNHTADPQAKHGTRSPPLANNNDNKSYVRYFGLFLAKSL